MTLQTPARLSAVVALFACAAAVRAESVPLTRDGAPRITILLPEQPQPLEKLAAGEIADHLRLITGAAIPVVRGTEAVPGTIPLRLGAACPPALRSRLDPARTDDSAFLIAKRPEGIDIAGASPEGTFFGACELLESLGVRWYHPGELGRVLPDPSPSLEIASGEVFQKPSFTYRNLQYINGQGRWPLHARLGGRPRPTGGHGIPPFIGQTAQELFAKHPEYFALADGARSMRQLCVSNPGVLDLAVQAIRSKLEKEPETEYVSLGPNDGEGYCECDECSALDRGVIDPAYGEVSMADRYIWFFNRVLERLGAEHRNLKLVWYIYARHMMPPKIQPDPRIVGALAPITLDRIRSINNPMSPDRHILLAVLDGWLATRPDELLCRDYLNNLACPQFPFSQLDKVRNDIPLFREKGIKVMRLEVINRGPSWAAQTPHLYLAARMMWDTQTDVDAVLAEFYCRYYGPAQAPMRRYHEGLEAAFRDTPFLTGSSAPYLAIFQGHPRRQELAAALREAGALAPQGSPFAARIDGVRKSWERLEVFLELMAARNSFDFVKARALLDRFNTLSDELSSTVLDDEPANPANKHRLLVWEERSANGWNMFNRFFRVPVLSGYERAVEKGEILAALPDTWDFLIDPVKVGTLAGYQRPGRLGGNWQPLKTASASWSDQGLHYYKGDAWYRTAVDIPVSARGRELFLWFGGVDRKASVWINGVFVGSSAQPEDGLPGVPGSFKPFDLPATKAIRPGETNWVAVRIEKEGLAELGTGGIVAPVMFWSPKSSDQRQ